MTQNLTNIQLLRHIISWNMDYCILCHIRTAANNCDNNCNNYKLKLNINETCTTQRFLSGIKLKIYDTQLDCLLMKCPIFEISLLEY